jgi:hypothetical protein
MNQLSELPFEYIVGYYSGTKTDGSYRKAFNGITKKWTLETAKNQLQRLEQDGENVLGIMRNIQLKNQGIVCIDIDDKIHYMDMIRAFPILKDTLYVAGNTKGGHFYFKTDWKGKKNYIECFDQLKGDIIITQMFELEGKEWLDKRIQTITSYELQNMVKESLFFEFGDSTDDESVASSTVSVVPSNTPNDVDFTPFHKSILDNINKDKYTSYPDWCKFLWAVRFSHFTNALDIADEYSKTTVGYVSKQDVENKMYDARSERIGWEYLASLSKKSNPVQHKIIMKQQIKNEDELTAKELYEKEKEKFEATHLKITNSGFYIREEDNKICILSEKKIKECYKHIQCGWSSGGVPVQFINKWIGCNNDIRSKKRLGVYPANNPPEDTYNMWCPFDMELVREWTTTSSPITLFKNHISILCNHQEEVTTWFLHWLAFCIQYPDKKRGNMPTFVSNEGAGKNLLLQVLRKLMGSSKILESTQPDRDVYGSFNGMMASAYLVILSELSATDLKDAKGRIKALITDETIMINQKGVDAYELPSYHKFIVFTNNEEAIKPTKGDRRNVVIRCSDELCREQNGVMKSEEDLTRIAEYIKNFTSILDNVNYQKTIFDWLKSLDVSQFMFETPPKTEFHKTQTKLTSNPIELFLNDFTLEHHTKDEVKLSSGSLYMLFKDWCNTNYKHYDCTNVQFAVRLKNMKIQGITTGVHTMKGNVIACNIPLLKQLFNIQEVHQEPVNNDIEEFSEL